MNQKFILIFGLPRSGTTWIGKIFDSHPDTLYRHEPDSWGLLNSIPLLPSTAESPKYEDSIRSFCNQLPHMNATKVSATLPVFRKRYYSPWRLQLRRIAISASKLGAKVFGEFSVPSLIPNMSLSTAPVVWKSIESVGRLGVIVKTLNNARAILIVRHPCGYVASVLRGESGHKFTGHIPTSEDYGILKLLSDTEQARRHGITLEHLKSLHPVERLAWRWALFNEKAMDDISQDTKTMLLRYEDICSAPIAKSKAMLEFAGVTWNPQTEQFIKRSTGEERTGYYSVIKNPEKAAHKWRGELSRDNIDRILNIANDTVPGRLYLDAAPLDEDPVA